MPPSSEAYLSYELLEALGTDNDLKRKLKIAYVSGYTLETSKNVYHLCLAVHDSDYSTSQRNKIWKDILNKRQEQNQFIHMSDLIDIFQAAVDRFDGYKDEKHKIIKHILFEGGKTSKLSKPVFKFQSENIKLYNADNPYKFHCYDFYTNGSVIENIDKIKMQKRNEQMFVHDICEWLFYILRKSEAQLREPYDQLSAFHYPIEKEFLDYSAKVFFLIEFKIF